MMAPHGLIYHSMMAPHGLIYHSMMALHGLIYHSLICYLIVALHSFHSLGLVWHADSFDSTFFALASYLLAQATFIKSLKICRYCPHLAATLKVEVDNIYIMFQLLIKVANASKCFPKGKRGIKGMGMSD
jgi:hypothetical protein